MKDSISKTTAAISNQDEKIDPRAQAIAATTT